MSVVLNNEIGSELKLEHLSIRKITLVEHILLAEHLELSSVR